MSVDPLSWDYNAARLIDMLRTSETMHRDLLTAVQANADQIRAIEKVLLVRATASKTRKALVGSLYGFAGMLLPYAIKYFFPHFAP